MKLFPDKKRQKILKDLTQTIPPARKEFCQTLFGNAPGSDLDTVGQENLLEGLKMAEEGLSKFSSHKAHISVLGNWLQVLNPDAPFIVDSVLSDINNFGLSVELVLHPIIEVKGSKLSLIQIYVNDLPTTQVRKLEASLQKTMHDVNVVVAGWQAMHSRVIQAIEIMKTLTPSGLKKADQNEAIAFLEWLAENHFIFMGLREYNYVGTTKKGSLEPSSEPGLGLLADPQMRVLREGSTLVTMSPEIRAFLHGPDPLIITKAGVRSRVHRNAYLDYIGVKLFDAKGHLTGELRMVGLFTSSVYNQSVKRIPLLRQKVGLIIKKSNLMQNSHSGKALLNILDTYPRDELFQIDQNQLEEFAISILQMDGRTCVRVFNRFDKFNRFVSCLVYVPRDRYNSDLRIKIGDLLASSFKGRVSAFYPAFPEGALARVHFIIGVDTSPIPQVDSSLLENKIEELARTWDDQFLRIATGHNIETTPDFSLEYKDSYTPDNGVEDARIISQLSDDAPLSVEFYERGNNQDNKIVLGVKLYNLGAALPLSRRVPMLEHFGFEVVDESTYEAMSGRVHLHDMTLQLGADENFNINDCKERLCDAFKAVWGGQAESDGFNALVVTAGFDWRMACVFRAYGLYLRQIKMGFSQDYLWLTLQRHSKIVNQLANLFAIRFDPEFEGERKQAQSKCLKTLENTLQQVENIDEDLIIRRFANVIENTLRTNYFQNEEDGSPRKIFAFKLNPKGITDLPEPRPFREIWVYGPEVEGVHLRFGPVARGGLRWSDRAQDFRTEILGLVKAQQVKNAVIVPVGAKGGFYPKQLPEMALDRNAWFEAGRDAYKMFISTLLTLTDNLDGARIKKPDNVICHDGDDPYFVVAADKGTATFSDTANDIAQNQGFWLDDAFASGGSVGYDHKKMGITARGGWEAVKRHFREMDWDIQTRPFTAVGVGDMSGDVFGNGMLLSKQTRLLAAFDHRDIFIDPDPDSASSYKERKRLFEMGRSSWQDYDKKLLSKGGLIVSRREKQIKLSIQAQKMLGVSRAQLTPNDLLIAILKAQSDLLWFGGIGTYIRASHETNADVGDRTNDPIRIVANEVGATVIGEGANLGLTQLARIEFIQAGGRCNSDAIDNSAGVNSSDVEVNIKIALSAAMRGSKLTKSKRNLLLEKMTDDVAELVLRNNYQQTLAITQEAEKGLAAIAAQNRFMQSLEREGLLDRAVEDLPDDVTISERIERNQSLTRAEIGVLLAYAKIVLFAQLVESDLPDDPYFVPLLMGYFPKAMQKPYADEINNHRLRREIIATLLANSVINRGGPTFIHDVAEKTGAAPDQIVRAYILCRDVNELQSINTNIDKLDNQIAWRDQSKLYAQSKALVQTQTIDLLRQGSSVSSLEQAGELYINTRRDLMKLFPKILPVYMREEFLKYEAQYLNFRLEDNADAASPVSKKLARQIAQLPLAVALPDLVSITAQTGHDISLAADVYYRVTETFRIGMIKDAADRLVPVDFYEGLALDRALQGLSDARRKISIDVLIRYGGQAKPVNYWLEAEKNNITRIQSALSGIVDDGALSDMSVSRLSVVANFLADLAKAN